MLYFKEFKNSLKLVKQNKADYSFLFLHLLVLQDLIVFLRNDVVLIAIFIFSFFIVNRKNGLNYKALIELILIFIFISIPGVLFIGLEFNTYFGFLIRILTGFFIISYFKDKLFEIFENLIFIIAYISIFLFTIKLIFPQFFNIFIPLSNLLIDPLHIKEGHRYLIVFWFVKDQIRNSGMFWEPAVYSGVIAWAILFNVFINRFEINKKLIIFALAGLTAFSVGFLLYFSLILLLYIAQKNVKGLVYVAILSVVFFALYTISPIVQERVQMMADKVVDENKHIENARFRSVDNKSISRVAGWIINTEYFLDFPFGYGIQKKSGEFEYLGASPNGFLSLAVQWGIFGLIIMFIGIWRTSKYLIRNYYPRINNVAAIIVPFIIIAPFNGNPFTKQPIVFAILLIGFYLNGSYIVKNKLQKE